MAQSTDRPSSRPVLVEACCDSVPTAMSAVEYGADRIELCGPGDGGTTPSAGLMTRCRDAVQVPIHVMIRPHTHGFVYDHEDLTVMVRDIEVARALGMEGVVLGPLQVDHRIHREQLRQLVEAAGPMRVAFHRAFDRTPDPIAALHELIDANVQLVLTAGHAPTALEGAAMLRTLRAHAGDRLVILAGGGVRGDNVTSLVERTGLSEVHARSTDPTIVRDVVLALEKRPRE
ncbi:copper homeostasis protein CutC [Gemmatimonas aurantiaca]|uniref:copper homeostasis protein CutC n=1 Tax=Gemmatimonas aurantiaca TaxID=173480 RepID=UPI00301C61C8